MQLSNSEWLHTVSNIHLNASVHRSSGWPLRVLQLINHIKNQCIQCPTDSCGYRCIKWASISEPSTATCVMNVIGHPELGLFLWICYTDSMTLLLVHESKVSGSWVWHFSIICSNVRSSSHNFFIPNPVWYLDCHHVVAPKSPHSIANRLSSVIYSGKVSLASCFLIWNCMM